MKYKIKAKNKEQLKDLIKEEIELHGYSCDLNHIDVSAVKDLSYLFFDTIKPETESFNYILLNLFTGDISQWDTSNVENMSKMFYQSKFNGDISKWNVSNVTSMHYMFYESIFHNDISQWNVINVGNIVGMFAYSAFNQNLNDWQLKNIQNKRGTFTGSALEKENNLPFWAKLSPDEIKQYLEKKQLFNELNNEFNQTNITHTNKLKL